MATESSPNPLKEYLVLVPDRPNSLHIRRQTKKAHITGATPLINDGRLPYFGVTLTKHNDMGAKKSDATDAAQSSSDLDINGSLMVMKAENEQSVRDFLEADAYTQQGVWDVKNAKIMPFKAG